MTNSTGVIFNQPNNSLRSQVNRGLNVDHNYKHYSRRSKSLLLPLCVAGIMVGVVTSGETIGSVLENNVNQTFGSTVVNVRNHITPNQTPSKTTKNNVSTPTSTATINSDSEQIVIKGQSISFAKLDLSDNEYAMHYTLLQQRSEMIKALKSNNLVAADIIAKSMSSENIEASFRSEALYVLAKLAASSEDMKLAYRWIRSAVKTNPSNVEYLIFAGDIALVGKLYKSAFSHFSSAVHYATNNKRIDQIRIAAALEGMGVVFYVHGNLEQSRSMLQRALSARKKVQGETHIDTAGTIYHLARIHIASGDLKSAESLFAQAVTIASASLDDQDYRFIRYSHALSQTRAAAKIKKNNENDEQRG